MEESDEDASNPEESCESCSVESFSEENSDDALVSSELSSSQTEDVAGSFEFSKELKLEVSLEFPQENRTKAVRKRRNFLFIF